LTRAQFPPARVLKCVSRYVFGSTPDRREIIPA
jgi:hypothetical protein